MRTLPVLLLVLACNDKATDSAAGSDSGDTVNDGLTITGSISQPEDTELPLAVTVGVVHVEFDAGPAIGSTIAADTVEADGSFVLTLPEAPESTDLYELVETEGINGGTYFVIAWEDDDADDAFSEGELLLGAPFSAMVTWLEETTDSGGALPDGWTAGWSIVDSGMSGTYETGNCLLDTDNPLTWRDYAGYPIFSDISTPVTVPLAGLPASLTMSGTSVDFERVGVFAYQEVSGSDDIDAFADVAASDTFSLTLTDAPPDTALITSDPDWNYALGIPQPYEDLDDSGDYADDIDDREGTTTCYDGEDAVARYTMPVSTWRGWRLMECYEANAGWRLVTQAEDGGWRAFQSSEAATQLHLELGECHW